MAAVQVIASGRDADVFALDETTVLRRCRSPEHRCEPEATTMEWVRALGYPVPRVYSVQGPEMVLEWVRGPTMRSSLLSGTTAAEDAGRTLADLHRRLHALPPPSPGRTDGAVRHLDLHPDNIIESATGPVVIDWRNSDVGPAGDDVALTAVIIAQRALSPWEHAEKAQRLLDAYLAAAGILDPPSVHRAVAYRSADHNLTDDERGLLSNVAEVLLG
jgi:aminoglycoside phosphotransferase (APT) family kinase protein